MLCFHYSHQLPSINNNVFIFHKYVRVPHIVHFAADSEMQGVFLFNETSHQTLQIYQQSVNLQNTTTYQDSNAVHLHQNKQNKTVHLTLYFENQYPFDILSHRTLPSLTVKVVPVISNGGFSTAPHFKHQGDFPGGLVIKNMLSIAKDTGSVLGWRTKVPHALGQLSLQVKLESLSSPTKDHKCCNYDPTQPRKKNVLIRKLRPTEVASFLRSHNQFRK